jgi:hypothetical protein
VLATRHGGHGGARGGMMELWSAGAMLPPWEDREKVAGDCVVVLVTRHGGHGGHGVE